MQPTSCIVTFQNASYFCYYIRFHISPKLSKIQTKKHNRIVYGFKETFIKLTKLSCDIPPHQPQTVSTKDVKEK